MLTNSSARNKPGPKEADAGSLYAFAHQAYWGFRFLAQNKQDLWGKILSAASLEPIREVGTTCSQPGAMTGAGYGATGAMTYLNDENVGLQVLSAKRHRRFPRSKRPTSEDRRMIVLGIAVAAGVFELSFETALRKLAERKLGIKHTAVEVHRHDRFIENLRSNAFVWAEPVGNYFWRLADEEWTQLHDLPCAVPSDWQGGYIIYGVGPSGSYAIFSRTLPTELARYDADNAETQGDKIK